ncbi:DUF4288 domain-containing protein [Saccharopolyspora phatthalungensis]|uniref:DUF4288 domain-containing protein n=1 Tax=Saccharopolyspora phatthalungensis TaxID=664693 RepID=A0A840PT59_9PSEU|nr:DUF4288 domain-containing protein [Saccharopolyspora phatthalungensis]MBB5153472.1 hypothetical protein [Saccharopolyspora phatthalungensis]
MSSNDFDAIGSINIGPGTIDPREFQADADAVELDYYIAVLVLEATSDAANHKPWYEESFVLLKAESEEEATEKAAEHGKQQETSYQNENHELITWKLKKIIEVKPVEDATFDDGTELYSRFFRNYEAYSGFEPLTEEDL